MKYNLKSVFYVNAGYHQKYHLGGTLTSGWPPTWQSDLAPEPCVNIHSHNKFQILVDKYPSSYHLLIRMWNFSTHQCKWRHKRSIKLTAKEVLISITFWLLGRKKTRKLRVGAGRTYSASIGDFRRRLQQKQTRFFEKFN